ncbi:MAG: hypothetical protein E2590_17360 [Chryseobacterium sp.]|nr:hypothetical protein [Chryseobacterium sp.]
MNLFSKIFKKNKSNGDKEKSKIKISDFETIDNFWEYIINQDKWYLKFSPYDFPEINNYINDLAQLIIETTNDLRTKMNFTYDEYWKIVDWDNIIIREDMNKESDFKLKDNLNFKQFCSNCNSKIGFTQRYPKTICNNCRNKLTDKDGRKVEFYNTEALGSGCQGYYSDTNQNEKYNSTICYLINKEYFADEGRFGGIVIQLKE